MRLPFLSAGPAKPSEYRPSPKAIAGQGQRATGTWQAPGTVPSRAIAAQGQQATARGRSRAIAAQGQAARAQSRPRVLARQGQRATATASVGAGRWPNGYLNQHEIRLRAWPGGGTPVANFLLPFAEQSDAFKTVANGGGVEHASGYDIRFETTGGTKLGHIMISYDGTTGRVRALVNMPRSFSAAESIFLYVGKPGLGSSEESAANARAGGWLAWFKGGSVTDLTGQGRNLTASGTPGATTLLGWPAYDFDGIDDYLGQADSSWLNGKTAISALTLYDADFQNQLRELFNVSVGTAGELGYRFKASDRRTVAIAKFGTSTYLMESANSTQPEVDGPSVGPHVLFANPFNKYSAHHRPIGAGAQKGIPGTTGTPTRGRLAIVDHILCSAGPELTKYHNRVSASDPSFTITRRGTEGGGTGLPVTLKMPNDASLYPPSINPVDRTVTLYPRNGGTDDICDLFYRFGFPTKDAADHRVYGLAGVDWPGDDSGDGGTSASRLRYPSCVLTLADVQAASPGPIRHALQAVATRIGDPASSHILGKTYVWPAKGTDGNAGTAGNNTGDIPYGTRLYLPQDVWATVDALSLTARQRAIAQCFKYYGLFLVDGTGPEGDGDGKIDVRVDGPLGKNGSIVTEINGAFAALLPYLWPMRNPRPLGSETEVWTDGLPYAGGGGPIDANSVNTAYDAS